jgi:hypothetical protein
MRTARGFFDIMSLQKGWDANARERGTEHLDRGRAQSRIMKRFYHLIHATQMSLLDVSIFILATACSVDRKMCVSSHLELFCRREISMASTGKLKAETARPRR